MSLANTSLLFTKTNVKAAIQQYGTENPHKAPIWRTFKWHFKQIAPPHTADCWGKMPPYILINQNQIIHKIRWRKFVENKKEGTPTHQIGWMSKLYWKPLAPLKFTFPQFRVHILEHRVLLLSRMLEQRFCFHKTSKNKRRYPLIYIRWAMSNSSYVTACLSCLNMQPWRSDDMLFYVPLPGPCAAVLSRCVLSCARYTSNVHFCVFF